MIQAYYIHTLDAIHKIQSTFILIGNERECTRVDFVYYDKNGTGYLYKK